MLMQDEHKLMLHQRLLGDSGRRHLGEGHVLGGVGDADGALLPMAAGELVAHLRYPDRPHLQRTMHLPATLVNTHTAVNTQTACARTDASRHAVGSMTADFEAEASPDKTRIAAGGRRTRILTKRWPSLLVVSSTWSTMPDSDCRSAVEQSFLVKRCTAPLGSSGIGAVLPAAPKPLTVLPCSSQEGMASKVDVFKRTMV